MRTCLECEHLFVDGGSQGYSEYTPSTPFQCECLKGHDVGYHGYDTTKKSLCTGLMRAGNCPDFKEEV